MLLVKRLLDLAGKSSDRYGKDFRLRSTQYTFLIKPEQFDLLEVIDLHNFWSNALSTPCLFVSGFFVTLESRLLLVRRHCASVQESSGAACHTIAL